MALKMQDSALSSEFEAKGKWWLPNATDRKIAGTLSYTSGRVELDLLGTLSTGSPSDFGKVGDSVDCLPLIYGDTNIGRCTLVNSYVTQVVQNLVETTHTQHSSTYLLLGSHVENEMIPSESVTFGCSHLDDFLVSQGFTVEDDRDESTFRGTTVRYVAPIPQVFELPSEELHVTFDQNLISSVGRTSMSLTARHLISLTPSAPKPLRWHLDRVWRVCNLLTLLTDEIVHPERIEIVIEGASSPTYLFCRTISPQFEERQPSSLLLFYSGHVIEQFGEILTRWFAASPTLTNSIHLFMDGQRQKGSSEGRFLTLSQALEAFSRATTVSTYMPSETYEAIKDRITAAIPCNVSSDHRLSLKSRIKYGNEYSLRKRLTQAVESLPPDAIELICKSKSKFVSGVVDTRNYLTHYSDELRENALHGAKLFWATERMAMLLRILLLRELGIDMPLITQRIREHSRLLQYHHLYHKHPETAS